MEISRAARARRGDNDPDLVGVRIEWKESELRVAVKRAGGIWRPRRKLWELSWDAVRALGLLSRVVEERSRGEPKSNTYGIWFYIPVDVCMYR